MATAPDGSPWKARYGTRERIALERTGEFVKFMFMEGHSGTHLEDLLHLLGYIQRLEREAGIK